jgi:hypothetical protein
MLKDPELGHLAQAELYDLEKLKEGLKNDKEEDSGTSES